MNSELFIARRIIKGDASSGRLSRPITMITVVAIAISMIFMILSMAVVTGFQSEIRNKVVGFGSHIQIHSFASNHSLESMPIPIEQDFYPHLDTLPGVRHIQLYAIKPGIVQTSDEIQGVITKGIGPDFDWSFFEENLKEGHIISWDPEEVNDSILISKYISKRLKIGLHDTMTTYFIPQSSSLPKRKQFKVAGIYETGLEEFDQEIIMIDMRHIQSLSNWGVKVFLNAEYDCVDEQMAITATARGLYKNFDFEWENPAWKGKGPHLICPTSDTVIRVVARDYPFQDLPAAEIIPDTAWLKMSFLTPPDGTCRCDDGDFETELTTSGGSGRYYTGGWEVLLEDYDQLYEMDEMIYHPSRIGEDKTTATITEQYPEIFSWLAMIDVNVWIIIILMIIVSTINMASALLILILEKTNMIGILKAMGITNWSIRKIFLSNAAWLAVRGMIWGNIFGIGLALIQKYTGAITLPQENYYLSEVPINLQWDHILLINIGTIIICVLAMIVPSYLITKIAPVKAIRFN